MSPAPRAPGSPLQFIGVEFADLPDAFHIEGAAVDVDGVGEQADGGFEVSIDVIGELALGVGERVRGELENRSIGVYLGEIINRHAKEPPSCRLA